MVNRRQFARLGMLVAAGALGCPGSNRSNPSGSRPVVGPGNGRLTAQWHAPSGTLAPGEHPLGIGGDRDGYLRVPSGYRPEQPAPLALLLHGAAHDAQEWAGGFPIFDALGMIALAVDSRASTWDRTFTSDVAFLESALARAFDLCNVDRTRLAIAGFSDGASYALSLGLVNGDLFTYVLGFSPGYLRADERHGKPPVFLTHGDQDRILPVTFTRELATELRAQGYAVEYREFAGGHGLSTELAEQAFQAFVSA